MSERRAPRYTVVDRGANEAAHLRRYSAANPRYWVWDNETGQAVDELTTRKAAADVARTMNKEAS